MSQKLSSGQRRIIRISYENVRAKLLSDRSAYRVMDRNDHNQAHAEMLGRALDEFNRTRQLSEGRLIHRMITILKMFQRLRDNYWAHIQKWKLPNNHYDWYAYGCLQSIVHLIEDELSMLGETLG